MSAGFLTLVAWGSLASATDAVPADIALKERGFGWVLTNAQGMSLYTTVKDQVPGKSACTGPCAEQFPPMIASAGAKPEGDWSLIKRDDGAMQWAFRDQPLYLFSGDSNPNESYGDDRDGEWSVAVKYVDRPSSVGVARTLLGHVFIDARTGTALYKYSKDKKNESNCKGACVRDWEPHKAPRMAKAAGDWTIVERGDGIRQWAYKGTPLYRYTGDLVPGDTRGHEAEKKAWLAYVLEPLPPLPSWVTVQASDAGLILADSQGRTLYGRTQSRIRNPNLGDAAVSARPGYQMPGESTLSERPGYEMPGMGRTTNCIECPRSYWKPVFATAEDKPVGNWSIVKRSDGKYQWAFKGEPLYTHDRDTWRGALNGVRSGDRSWHALMRSGLPMQGTGN